MSAPIVEEMEARRRAAKEKAMYRVTIEKVETVTVQKSEWVEGLPDAVTRAKAIAPDNLYRDEKAQQTTKVLEQSVDSLDLAAVIKAVNGL